jgi:hypothetical protein
MPSSFLCKRAFIACLFSSRCASRGRGEVQRSLNAIKKAYEHQRQGKRGDME